MAKYSSAYSDLISRMKEIHAIVSMGRAFARPTPSNLDKTSALGRAGVVLLCSHIEGYIETLGNLAIARIAGNSVPKASMAREFRYHLSRDLIEEINKSPDPDKIAEKIDGLMRRDLSIWDNSTYFASPLPVESFTRTFSTPRHNNIRQFFRRFGYTNFDGELASRLQGDFPVCTNMIDRVVEERNKIAHGNALAKVTPNDLQAMSVWVRLYCRNTDHVVGDWFRGKGCTIR